MRFTLRSYHRFPVQCTLVLASLCATSVWAGWKEGHDAYEHGDYATALNEWGPMAQQGDAGVQLMLGTMYEEARGVAQDYREAARWYRLAADQGNQFAQVNLGNLYVEGQGVPQDFVQAHMWFNLAGSAGSKKAMKSRDILAKKMTPVQIAEAQKLAREWKPIKNQ